MSQTILETDVSAYDPQRWIKNYPASARSVTSLTPFPLYEMLDRAAADFPDRPMASIGDYVLSYEDARVLSHKAALGLMALGIKPGDRIGYCMPNSPVYSILCFALWRIGAAFVGLNPLYSEDKIVEQARDSGVKAVIIGDDPTMQSKAEALAAMEQAPVIVVSSLTNHDIDTPSPVPDWDIGSALSVNELVQNNGEVVPQSFDLTETVAALQYTGGTTGEPKAAMLTHACLSVNVQQMHAWYAQLERGKEVLLAVAPFTHVSGVGPIQNFTVFMAGEMAMVQRFIPNDALDLIQSRKVSVLLAPPTMFVGLMNAAESHPIDWSSVKLVQSGAGPLTDEIRQRFEELCGVPVQNLYGMTENSPACIYNLPNSVEHGHPMAVGLPLPLTEVQIRDAENPSKCVPIGEVGEICIKGPQRMKAYWARPEATEAAFLDGFFRSGDLGYMTEEGFVYVVDRLKDMIICSGYNVYPVQLENTISQHPSIREVAVIGVPDDYRGESVKMFVAFKPGMSFTLDEFKSDMESKLSPIEMPREMEVMEELPKTPNAKISRVALRDLEMTRRAAS